MTGESARFRAHSGETIPWGAHEVLAIAVGRLKAQVEDVRVGSCKGNV